MNKSLILLNKSTPEGGVAGESTLDLDCRTFYYDKQLGKLFILIEGKGTVKALGEDEEISVTSQEETGLPPKMTWNRIATTSKHIIVSGSGRDPTVKSTSCFSSNL